MTVGFGSPTKMEFSRWPLSTPLYHIALPPLVIGSLFGRTRLCLEFWLFCLACSSRENSHDGQPLMAQHYCQCLPSLPLHKRNGGRPPWCRLTHCHSIHQKDLYFYILLASISMWETLDLWMKFRAIYISTNIEIGILRVSYTLTNSLIWIKDSCQLRDMPANFKNCNIYVH